MPSEKTQTTLEAIKAWTQTLPNNVVSLEYPPIPEDDDYGLELIAALKPKHLNGCPLELGLIPSETQSGIYTYISLDKWASIAQRLHCSVSPSNADLIGLYIEPEKFSIDQILEICQAVANGAVYLEAGIVRGYLVLTQGCVNMPGGILPMHGINAVFPGLVGAAALLGYGAKSKVPYEPWC